MGATFQGLKLPKEVSNDLWVVLIFGLTLFCIEFKIYHPHLSVRILLKKYSDSLTIRIEFWHYMR